MEVVKAGYAKCLADMLVHAMSATITYNGAVTRPQILTLLETSGPLELKRTRGVLHARAWGADYLLWIDSDQTFPPDALLRLLKHDVPVVGCNYPTRGEPALPTALGFEGEDIWTTEAQARSGELQRVAALGLGFCLIKVPIFEIIDRQLPGVRLFQSDISPAGELITGEDVHFFNQVRKAGLPVFLDHGLSWQIGHLAETERRNSDATAPAGAVAAGANASD